MDLWWYDWYFQSYATCNGQAYPCDLFHSDDISKLVILSLHDLGSIEVAILKVHSKTYLYAVASSIELQKNRGGGIAHYGPNEAATLDNSFCMHPILKYQLNW
jgi:hypothetical protein